MKQITYFQRKGDLRRKGDWEENICNEKKQLLCFPSSPRSRLVKRAARSESFMGFVFICFFSAQLRSLSVNFLQKLFNGLFICSTMCILLRNAGSHKVYVGGWGDIRQGPRLTLGSTQVIYHWLKRNYVSKIPTPIGFTVHPKKLKGYVEVTHVASFAAQKLKRGLPRKAQSSD